MAIVPAAPGIQCWRLEHRRLLDHQVTTSQGESSPRPGEITPHFHLLTLPGLQGTPLPAHSVLTWPCVCPHEPSSAPLRPTPSPVSSLSGPSGIPAPQRHSLVKPPPAPKGTLSRNTVPEWPSDDPSLTPALRAAQKGASRRPELGHCPPPGAGHIEGTVTSAWWRCLVPKVQDGGGLAEP